MRTDRGSIAFALGEIAGRHAATLKPKCPYLPDEELLRRWQAGVRAGLRQAEEKKRARRRSELLVEHGALTR